MQLSTLNNQLSTSPPEAKRNNRLYKIAKPCARSARKFGGHDGKTSPTICSRMRLALSARKIKLRRLMIRRIGRPSL